MILPTLLNLPNFILIFNRLILNTMYIKYKIILLSMFLSIWGFSNDCTLVIDNISIVDENILTIYLNYFDNNTLHSNPDIFTVQINFNNPSLSADCESINNLDYLNSSYTLYYSFKIYSPHIGFSNYELFYSSEVALNTIIENQIENKIYRNKDFEFTSGLNTVNNFQADKLISYIGESGKLPSGKYLFEFMIKNDNSGSIIDIKSEFLEINIPLSLELLYPGGEIAEINNSYIYNIYPVFTWYSDYCKACNYGIRISEYDQDKHTSLYNALNDYSLIPFDQGSDYYDIPWNIHSFQYPFDGSVELEENKYYVWQIRRSYKTTIDLHYDYSPIYIFQIRSFEKEHVDLSDSLLLLIQSLVGKDQFDLWFNHGGELENFILDSEYIWINGEEMHIENLNLLALDLRKGKIKIESVKVE